MRTSQRGIDLIKSFEALKLEAYPDPGTGGAPYTIGWGHTGKDVHPGLVWTKQHADEVFARDLLEREAAVNQLVTVELTQGQFDALVSFVYNVGADIDADTIAEGLGDSTLLKKLNQRDYTGASQEFVKWNKSRGRVMAGLTRRREAEKELFLT